MVELIFSIIDAIANECDFAQDLYARRRSTKTSYKRPNDYRIEEEYRVGTMSVGSQGLSESSKQGNTIARKHNA
jgi:hypothetical protein